MKKDLVGLNAAISLLDCFSIEKPELGLSDICKRSGFPKANAIRYLKALKDADLIMQDESTKKYSLGYKIYKLFHIVSNTKSLHKVALRYMQELRDANNETVSLTVINGNYGVCIERVLNTNGLKHMPEIGIEKPLNAGAARKVLLAFMPEARIQEIIGRGLEKVTKNTITDPEILIKDLLEIRQRGYSVSKGENNPGVKSISVPIWYNGSVIGGLSIGGPAFRISKEKEQHIFSQLQKASDNISKELGSLTRLTSESD